MQVYQTITQVGPGKPVLADWQLPNFALTAAVYGSGGSVYSVEYTLDDVNNAVNQPVRWFTEPLAPVGTTSTGLVLRYLAPIYFIRINVTVLVGTLEFKVLQGTPH